MLTHSFSVWKVFIHLCIISDVELCLINFHLSLIDGIDMEHCHVLLQQRVNIQNLTEFQNCRLFDQLRHSIRSRSLPYQLRSEMYQR